MGTRAAMVEAVVRALARSAHSQVAANWANASAACWMKTFRVFLALLVLGAAARGDTVYLKNGGTLKGVILKEDESEVLLRLKFTTATISRSEIKSIEKGSLDTSTSASKWRLASWDRCIDFAAKRAWFRNIRAIPATVVDKGILRNVPYKSFRAGDYELNIYGDPDRPSCIEVGIFNDLLQSQFAKRQCVELIDAVLNDAQDRAVLKTLNFTKDRKSNNGLTLEVTPATDEDAYGGWWVSAYDEKELEKARATEKELAAITVRKADVAIPSAAAAQAQYNSSGYSPSDLRYARAPSSGSTGGRVYVNGYYRKNGTYVHSHTRSAPGSGGRR